MGQTRLIARYRDDGFLQPALHANAPDAPRPVRLIGCAVRQLPGADLLARGFDFFLVRGLQPPPVPGDAIGPPR